MTAKASKKGKTQRSKPGRATKRAQPLVISSIDDVPADCGTWVERCRRLAQGTVEVMELKQPITLRTSDSGSLSGTPGMFLVKRPQSGLADEESKPLNEIWVLDEHSIARMCFDP